MKNMKAFAKRYEAVRDGKIRDLKINFAMFRIKYQWKMRKKKFRGFDNQLKEKLRFCTTVVQNCFVKNKMEYAAENILLPFLKEYTLRMEIKNYMYKYYADIESIQKKFRKQIIMKAGKLQILNESWDFTLKKM